MDGPFLYEVITSRLKGSSTSSASSCRVGWRGGSSDAPPGVSGRRGVGPTDRGGTSGFGCSVPQGSLGLVGERGRSGGNRAEGKTETDPREGAREPQSSDPLDAGPALRLSESAAGRRRAHN